MTLTRPVRSTFPVGGLVVASYQEGPTTVVAVQGEADIGTLPVLLDRLAHAMTDHEGGVVVDLAQTDFLDTATARAIGWATKALHERGRQLTIRSPSRLATLVFSFLSLGSLIEDQQDEGLKCL